MKIATRVRQIKKKQDQLYQELVKLQAQCLHDNSEYEAGANTGNWSPSDDCYWYDWYCPDCDKRWTTEQAYSLTIGKRKKVKTISY